MWNSYPSIYALGHRALTGLFAHDVRAEEKVDGSQFSFGLIGGELRCRSKGAEIHPDAPDKLFARAVAVVQERKDLLHPGWVYRAEYLAKPKHSTLAYERTPTNHLMVFDVEIAPEDYLTAEQRDAEAQRLGLESVPILFEGRLPEGQPGFDLFKSWLERTSVLGGVKIEGIVFKNYSAYGPDKRILIGKFVSEEFKEQHKVEWKKTANSDVLLRLITAYKTQARWRKAVEHLRDAGALQNAPQDIGLLIREVPKDIAKECEAEVKERLWEWAWPHVSRGVVAGFAEWYKEQLAASQFNAES